MLWVGGGGGPDRLGACPTHRGRSEALVGRVERVEEHVRPAEGAVGEEGREALHVLPYPLGCCGGEGGGGEFGPAGEGAVEVSHSLRDVGLGAAATEEVEDGAGEVGDVALSAALGPGVVQV